MFKNLLEIIIYMHTFMFKYNNSWLNYAFSILLLVLIVATEIIVIGLLIYFLAWIYDSIFYKKLYSKVITYDGNVVDMKYTPMRTQSHWDGKSMITTTTPEKNEVFIETKIETFEIDSDCLYQRVRVDEAVKVSVQRVYKQPRFWFDEPKFCNYLVIDVINVKEKVININEIKEINPHLM